MSRITSAKQVVEIVHITQSVLNSMQPNFDDDEMTLITDPTPIRPETFWAVLKTKLDPTIVGYMVEKEQELLQVLSQHPPCLYGMVLMGFYSSISVTKQKQPEQLAPIQRVGSKRRRGRRRAATSTGAALGQSQAQLTADSKPTAVVAPTAKETEQAERQQARAARRVRSPMMGMDPAMLRSKLARTKNRSPAKVAAPKKPVMPSDARCKDPRVSKWFDMLDAGKARFQVEFQMRRAGVNPRVLCDPEKPVPDNWQIKK
eukprot:gnl/Dysnectes_brevis/2173_a2531_791.p1 GENE.gnl/Dysnectes_brevis/2173_a2531_791~~gnl/Dysnectes_brevis/2173_a2531_791.p1  ORF type:complete len:259 (-),score=97.25 gnl/Dysnectes_brevis/2173_a2531_791:53-829(-)